MYLLIRAAGHTNRGTPVPFLAALFNEGRIYTAGAPFEAGKWDQPLVNFPHPRTTPIDIFFPKDLPTSQDIADQIYSHMVNAMSGVQKLLQNVSPYPESTNAFEVLGVNFALSGSLLSPKLTLLEINDTVEHVPVLPAGQYFHQNFTDFPAEFSQFSRRYWQFVYDNAIIPFFELPLVPPPCSLPPQETTSSSTQSSEPTRETEVTSPTEDPIVSSTTESSTDTNNDNQ